MIVRMKYRTNVPYGWIAIPFCNVSFIGATDKEQYDAIELKIAHGKVIHEKYNKVYPAVRDLKDKIEKAKSEMEKCDQAIRENRILGIIPNQTAKIARKTRNNLFRSVESMENEVRTLTRENMDSAFEQVMKTTRFLAEHGFHMVSSTEGTCNTHTEVWEN